MEDFDIINRNFAGLVDSTLQALNAKNITLNELKVAVKMYLPQNKEVYNLFLSAKSLNEMFLDDLFGYWTFFDYELLAFIIERRCKEELQGDLNKRKFSEVPTNFNSKACGKYYNLVVKINKKFDHITMEQVKMMEDRLKNITSLDLSLSRVGDGCIELVFISLSGSDEMYLNAQDRKELFQMGVLKLYCANSVYFESLPSGTSQRKKQTGIFTEISQPVIKLIIGAFKESKQIEDLATSLGMSDCVKDVNGDVGILLKLWQERADTMNTPKLSSLLYHLARIGMQDLHARLVLFVLYIIPCKAHVFFVF